MNRRYWRHAYLDADVERWANTEENGAPFAHADVPELARAITEAFCLSIHSLFERPLRRWLGTRAAVWLFDQQLDRHIGGTRTDFRRAARWPLRAQPKSLYLRGPGGKRGAPGDRSSRTRPPPRACARSDAAVTQAVAVR